MILQVHDELLFEVPAGEAEKLKEKIVKIMDNVIQISVPVTAQANIGNNWGEIH